MTNREEVAARLRETGKDNNDWSMGVNTAFFKIDDILRDYWYIKCARAAKRGKRE